MTIRMMPRPALISFVLLLSGCAAHSPQTATVAQTTDNRALTGDSQLVGTWVVAAIGEHAVEGHYSPRIAFGADERVGGIAGCNRFLGSFQLHEGGALTIGDMKLTRRLCPEPVMQQEALLLSRLRNVESSALTPSGELLLYSEQYPLPIRLRPVRASVQGDTARSLMDG